MRQVCFKPVGKVLCCNVTNRQLGQDNLGSTLVYFV